MFKNKKLARYLKGRKRASVLLASWWYRLKGSDLISRLPLTSYILLCLSHTSMHTFTQMHIALIPVFRTELGLNTLAIGLMASSPLLFQAIMTIPGGLLADRFNRSRIIAVGLVMTGISGILLSQTNSIPMLILLTSLLSVSSTLIHPSALSSVSDIVSPKIRGRAIGVFSSAGTFGISLGPITLSFFMSSFGWRFVYLMWSIPALLLPALMLRVKVVRTIELQENQHEKQGSKLAIFRNMSLLLLFALMAGRAMSSTVVNTYITPYFVDNWKLLPATASLIFGMRPLLGIFAAPIGGIMVDKIGEKKWIAIGLVVQVAGILILAFPLDIFWLICGFLLYGFFGNMEMPAIQSLVVKLTPKESRGLAFSLSFLPHTLVGALSPVLAALIVETYGIWGIFPFSLAMLLIALFFLNFLRKRSEPIQEEM